ncbi:MAG: SUMF1/EgtB/PvdO family nonheme iron enzyme [Candidatus Micrarchaeota archaeon]
MRKTITLLLIALLLFGCTEEGKPTPSPKPTVKNQPLIQFPSPSPTIIPSPTPNPLKFVALPTVKITNTTALVSWTTNLKSNTIIEYGKTDGYGETKMTANNVTSHAINVTGLEFVSEYHFRAISCDGDACVKSNGTVAKTGHKQCPGGMSYIADGDFCMDNFEAFIVDGKAAISGAAVPRNMISKADAIRACENAGKRMCTSKEFDAACNVKGEKFGHIGNNICNVQNTSYIGAGFATNCTSAEGVHDLIGNLWEWVSDVTTDKTPIASGLVDRDDILTAGRDYVLPRQFNVETERRGGDYYYNVESNPGLFVGKGIARGGYYESRQGGGCFSYQVGVPLEGDAKLGFRCCS